MKLDVNPEASAERCCRAKIWPFATAAVIGAPR